MSNDERDAAIIRMHERNLTLSQIAEYLAIKTEEVRGVVASWQGDLSATRNLRQIYNDEDRAAVKRQLAEEIAKGRAEIQAGLRSRQERLQKGARP